MNAAQIPAAEWWKKQRPNYVYVAMAAGILCFLAFAAIWETFYGTQGTAGDGLAIMGGILLGMVQHLLIWVPFLLLEIYAFRLLPVLDSKFNPSSQSDRRRLILVLGCLAVCFLPLLPPAILVWVHG